MDVLGSLVKIKTEADTEREARLFNILGELRRKEDNAFHVFNDLHALGLLPVMDFVVNEIPAKAPVPKSAPVVQVPVYVVPVSREEPSAKKEEAVDVSLEDLGPPDVTNLALLNQILSLLRQDREDSAELRSMEQSVLRQLLYRLT